MLAVLLVLGLNFWASQIPTTYSDDCLDIFYRILNIITLVGGGVILFSMSLELNIVLTNNFDLCVAIKG